jgi:hypothetical protein
LYRDLGHPSIGATLAELNAKYGTEVGFLSGSERNEVYFPIFGASDASSSSESDNFPRLRNDLLRAFPIARSGVQTQQEQVYGARVTPGLGVLGRSIRAPAAIPGSGESDGVQGEFGQGVWVRDW